MTTARLIEMAGGLTYVEVDFDDAENATTVRIGNGTDSPIAAAINDSSFVAAPRNVTGIPIPSSGIRAFTRDTLATACATWPPS